MSWPLNSIIYQIYPRSFKDSDGNGIGDIGGIIEKINYLKELGVDAVWLSPIYSSPQKDFGYDVSNHLDIDPIFGNIKLFDELVGKLHKNGIKIIMDFIPNHTSDKHPWFEESRKNKSNPKRDWYVWADPKGKDDNPPNNWISAFGGSAWEYDETTNQFYYHAFDSHQPDLNLRNENVRSEIFKIMKFWLDRGVDGFRTDAVDYLVEDARLLDEPPNLEYRPGFGEHTDRSLRRIYTRNQKESLEILKEIARVIQKYDNRFLASEASDASLKDLIDMYKIVDWHSYHPFNFSLIKLPWLASAHKAHIDKYETSLSDHYIPCYVSGNHDSPRVVSRIGKKQARNAAILLLTLRGNAFIYNGEEIGMRNRNIPKRFKTDTYDIHSPGLGLGRNGQRTPLQWNDKPFAGFSSNSNIKPWLPVAYGYEKTNIESERADPRSFLNLYKTLIKLKKTNKALSSGEYIPIRQPAKNVFAYIRKDKSSKVLVVINFESKKKKVSMKYSGTIILNNFLDRIYGETIDLTDFILREDEAIVIQL